MWQTAYPSPGKIPPFSQPTPCPVVIKQSVLNKKPTEAGTLFKKTSPKLQKHIALKKWTELNSDLEDIDGPDLNLKMSHKRRNSIKEPV